MEWSVHYDSFPSVARFPKEFRDAPNHSEQAKTFVDELCPHVLRWFAAVSAEKYARRHVLGTSSSGARSVTSSYNGTSSSHLWLTNTTREVETTSRGPSGPCQYVDGFADGPEFPLEVFESIKLPVLKTFTSASRHRQIVEWKGEKPSKGNQGKGSSTLKGRLPARPNDTWYMSMSRGIKRRIHLGSISK